MMYWKRTAVDRPLIIWWRVKVAKKGFYSHTIRSRSFSEPVPLDHKLHRYFSGFFSSPNGTKLLEPGGIEYYTLPGQLGSDITQQVRYCLTSFSCRKKRLFHCISKWFLFSFFCQKFQGIFLQYLQWKYSRTVKTYLMMSWRSLKF